jgi:hypothetical protein
VTPASIAAGAKRADARGDLRDRTLHVFATKTSRPRDVDLIAPLAQDLAEWRVACGRPPYDELVIPRPSRGQWTRAYAGLRPIEDRGCSEHRDGRDG